MNSPYTKNILNSFLGFTLLGICLYIFIALVSYNSFDPGFSSFSSDQEVLNLVSRAGVYLEMPKFPLGDSQESSRQWGAVDSAYGNVMPNQLFQNFSFSSDNARE